MAQAMITFDEMEAQLFQHRMEELFQKAYAKGVEDGRTKFSYPPVLTNKHLVEILQVKLPTVNKIVGNPTFPKLKEIRARYPRDEVFLWIDRNTTYIENYLS